MHTIAFMPHEPTVHAMAISVNFLRSHKYNSHDSLLPHLLYACVYNIVDSFWSLFFFLFFFFLFTKWLPFMTLSCRLRHL